MILVKNAEPHDSAPACIVGGTIPELLFPHELTYVLGSRNRNTSIGEPSGGKTLK